MITPGVSRLEKTKKAIHFTRTGVSRLEKTKKAIRFTRTGVSRLEKKQKRPYISLEPIPGYAQSMYMAL